MSRATEASIAGVLLIFTLPLIIIIAIAIRLDSPGPVFEQETCIGRGGAAVPDLAVPHHRDRSACRVKAGLGREVGGHPCWRVSPLYPDRQRATASQCAGR